MAGSRACAPYGSASAVRTPVGGVELELYPPRVRVLPSDLDGRAAGRDRVVDAARAVAMLAVAVGHWLVLDLQRGADGGLVATDVLARLPGLQYLSWAFQVMPVFFFAGGVVGFASWRRHRDAGGEAGPWVLARLWRLLWPTIPVVTFWVAATQLGRHLLGVDPALLDATRGIALVIWFLAIYAVVIALVPVAEAACARIGLGVPVGLAAGVAVVDVVAAATGYVSSTTPSWVWVNYLFVWGAVACLGRWWAPAPRAGDPPRGAALAVGAGAVLVAATALGWYPVSMVGVTGAVRSNTLPPTLALLSLGLAQVGLLVALRPAFARSLSRPRAYLVVAVLGGRAMTLYLWHLLAVAVLTLAVVLPGLWPTSAIGSGAWWWLRGAWVLAAAAITVPVVVAAGRVERPPLAAATRAGPARAGGAVVTAAVGWAALAIAGFHPEGMPGGVPVVAIGGLVAATGLVLWRAPDDRDGRPRGGD